MEDTSQVYGIRAVIEAIQAGEPIHKVFIQKGLQGQLFFELESLIRKKGISASYVPAEKLNRLTKNNHQGVVAEVSPVAFHDFEDLVSKGMSGTTPAFFLLLDGISDVRNFGAIIRTAECTGVQGIVVPRSGAAPVNADAVKTSAGAAFRVPIAKVDHLKDAVYYLQASGIQVIAATEKATENVFGCSLEGPIALVMGSEDSGISPSLLKITDRQVRLPLLGEIGSLNVSVACGVFLYEVVRQRMG